MCVEVYEGSWVEQLREKKKNRVAIHALFAKLVIEIEVLVPKFYLGPHVKHLGWKIGTLLILHYIFSGSERESYEY